LNREEIAEYIGEGAVFFDGFDKALMGVAQRCGTLVALYNAEKCIEVLQTDEGMNEEEAREYFDYNVVQAWVGDFTPIFAWLQE
jgi:hypothetical protein